VLRLSGLIFVLGMGIPHFWDFPAFWLLTGLPFSVGLFLEGRDDSAEAASAPPQPLPTITDEPTLTYISSRSASGGSHRLDAVIVRRCVGDAGESQPMFAGSSGVVIFRPGGQVHV
jgi:hypothetical protein